MSRIARGGRPLPHPLPQGEGRSVGAGWSGPSLRRYRCVVAPCGTPTSREATT